MRNFSFLAPLGGKKKQLFIFFSKCQFKNVRHFFGLRSSANQIRFFSYYSLLLGQGSNSGFEAVSCFNAEDLIK